MLQRHTLQNGFSTEQLNLVVPPFENNLAKKKQKQVAKLKREIETLKKTLAQLVEKPKS